MIGRNLKITITKRRARENMKRRNMKRKKDQH